jgi:hypothetical protein
MVLGVIEVTRFLDAGKLEEDLEKVARVRALGAKKEYAEWYEVPEGKYDARQRRPLGYVVGLDGNVTLKTIIDKVRAIQDDQRPNAIAILDKALYLRRPESEEFVRFEEDVLFRFLAVVRSHAERFPRGRTDLHAYLPGVADLCWEEDEELSSESLNEEDLGEMLDEESGP